MSECLEFLMSSLQTLYRPSRPLAVALAEPDSTFRPAFLHELRFSLSRPAAELSQLRLVALTTNNADPAASRFLISLRMWMSEKDPAG